jgi:hypothetical protein
MKLIGTIKNILIEESKRDLTSVIQILLDGFVNDHKDILCKVEVKHPDKRTKLPHSDNNYENYRVTFYLIGGYGSSNWPTTQSVLRKYDDLMNEAWELIHNYTGQALEMFSKHVKSCGDIIQESIKIILREETYSPASDEYTPGEYIVHKSNPAWRENIELTGLQTSVGDCYQQHVGGDVDCKESIFATDSLDKKQMFDSTYDDDIWIINTECAGVTWYKDKHFDDGDYKHHIVTFENISPDCLRLLHKGTGKSY